MQPQTGAASLRYFYTHIFRHCLKDALNMEDICYGQENGNGKPGPGIAGKGRLQRSVALCGKGRDHEVLPEFPCPGVTVRRLLTHTSGVPDYFDDADRVLVILSIRDYKDVRAYLGYWHGMEAIDEDGDELEIRLYPIGENESGRKGGMLQATFGDGCVMYGEFTCKKL